MTFILKGILSFLCWSFAKVVISRCRGRFGQLPPEKEKQKGRAQREVATQLAHATSHGIGAHTQPAYHSPAHCVSKRLPQPSGRSQNRVIRISQKAGKYSQEGSYCGDGSLQYESLNGRGSPLYN